jgi:hypothetical protein
MAEDKEEAVADKINDAINEYYKLKMNYESSLTKIKKRIIHNTHLSIKEKRREFAQIKPKCIHCKRPGGTIFSTTFDKTADARELKAICGVTAQPCKLNITILVGNYELFPITLNGLSEDIKDEKMEIINNKNQNIFGYISAQQTLAVFAELKDRVSDTTALYMSYLEEYLDIVENKQKKNDLKRDQEFFYGFISEIHEAINLFHTSDNTQYIRDAVDIYVTKLLPLLDKIMKLKYNERSVWYNENDNTYHLIQNKYSFKDIEFNVGHDKLISFVTK